MRQLSWQAPFTLAEDLPIQVELLNSGRTLHVPAGRTILDAMLEDGLDPLHDCERGECGMCVVPAVEGTPDRRDCFLSEYERACGCSICLCISRAKTERLVLDC